jgi:hypothetical protein
MAVIPMIIQLKLDSNETKADHVRDMSIVHLEKYSRKIYLYNRNIEPL